MLDVVEVCYRPWHRKVHGADLSHQALQLLLADMSLRGRDGEHLVQLLEFLLGEGYHTSFCVNSPPQEFLNTVPVALPHIKLLTACWVLGFPRQGQKEPF